MIDKILGKLPIVSCEEATRLASLFLERRLSFKEFINLKLHLMVCDLCVQFQKQIEGLRRLLRTYQPVKEKSLPLEAKQKIKKSLQNNS